MTIDIFENPTIYKCPSTKYLIKVTQKHIRNGVKGDALKCPVSYAIREIVRGDVLVTTRHVLYYHKKFKRKDIDVVLGKTRVLAVYLPEFVSKKVKLFEATGEMEKFEFEIEVPNSQIRKHRRKPLDNPST